jgi:hypothetical protein
MDKFGSKIKFHEISKKNQFLHSALKSDVGLITFLCITTYIFDRTNPALDIFDGILFCASIAIVFLMKKAVKLENKTFSFILLAFRTVLQIYIIFRVTLLLNITSDSPEMKKILITRYKSGYVSIIGASKLNLNLVILDGILFILICIYTFLCVAVYNQGFKEAREKQQEEKTRHKSTLKQNLISDYNQINI